MKPNDPTATGAEDTDTSASSLGRKRAERQADLVSRIMHARHNGDLISEKLLAAELLESVRPVIKRVARMVRGFAGSLSPGDLEQTAAIAVLRTVDKFDPSRGEQSFGEVAYFRARTACEQYARMHGGDVHLSDGAHKGRTTRAAHASNVIRCESTDAPDRMTDDGPARKRAGDELEAARRAFTNKNADDESPELLLLAAETRAAVFEAVRHLAPQQRELICRVYGINRPAQSVRSVAEAWGAPKSRVDRMLVRTLVELRVQLAHLGA